MNKIPCYIFSQGNHLKGKIYKVTTRREKYTRKIVNAEYHDMLFFSQLNSYTNFFFNLFKLNFLWESNFL